MAHVPNSSPNCIQDKKKEISQKKSMGNEPTWQKMEAIFFRRQIENGIKRKSYLELVDPRTITHCSFIRLNVIRRMKLNERKHFIFLP